MSVFLPDSASRPLTDQSDWLVACLCAAWCDTCTQYRGKFERLAARRPERIFAWIDIEDHPEYLGDEDVENFPTLLIQHRGRTVFFGSMLPHIEHLERLLDALTADSPTVQTSVPNIVHALCHGLTA